MSEQQKTQHNTQLQHHAFLIQGRKEDVADVITNVITSYGIECTGSPDYWEGEFDTFAIADARALKARQDRRASAGGKKIFVIYTNFFTHEAQNALLKVFEEPTSDTHFFVVTPFAGTLLPTLRSRLADLSLEGEKKRSRSGIDVGTFLASPPATRLKILNPLIEEKNKQALIALIEDLEDYFTQKDPDIAEYAPQRAELMRMRSFLMDRAPSVKMIAEYIAAIV